MNRATRLGCHLRLQIGAYGWRSQGIPSGGPGAIRRRSFALTGCSERAEPFCKMGGDTGVPPMTRLRRSSRRSAPAIAGNRCGYLLLCSRRCGLKSLLGKAWLFP